MANKNVKKFYQNSNQPYNYLPHAVGHGAPTTAPSDAGLMYIDIDSQTIYVSAGKSNVSDWKVVSGGGGSSITLSTNGISNGDQTALNLQEGDGISLVDNGSGQVTVSSTNTLYTKVQTVASYIDIDNSFSDVPELFLVPELAKSYTFRAVIRYSLPNTSYGSGWTIDLGTAVFGDTSWYSQVWDGTGSIVTNIALNSTLPLPTLTNDSYSGTYNIAIIEGVLTDCLVADPIVVRGAGSTSGITVINGVQILAGSSLVVYETL
jgi:hypothetical protein